MRAIRHVVRATLLMALFVANASAADITIGLAAAPSSADPYYHNAGPNNALAALLFDHLVQLDAHSAVIPALSPSWTLIDDHTWRFALAPGARFHDGSELTANDVVYSLCRPLAAISPTASFTGLPKELAGVDILDPHTIILHTIDPDPLLLLKLAGMAIISAHSGGVATARFDLASRCGGTPVPPSSAFDGGGPMANGSGRYWMEHYTAGDVIVLRGNPDHLGARPRWDRVTLKPVPNTGARAAGLLAGDFDLIEAPAAQDVARIKAQGFAALAVPSDRILFLQPDIGRAHSPQVTTSDGRNPLQDNRVRQAISLAIDRAAITGRLMQGAGTPADQYAPPTMPGAVKDPPARAYDPAKAKALLAEAGYPDGFALHLAATNDRYIDDALVAQALGQYLTRIGIRVSVDTMPQTVFFPDRPKRAFSLSLGGWGMGDASSILRTFIATTDAARAIGTSNYGGYSNPGFDHVLAAALVDMNTDRRNAQMADAARIALADNALIPLYWETTFWAYKNRFTYQGRVDQMTDPDDLQPKE